ncbi:MAG: BBP7 family outer membrane beta-barrel protein [Planctomycetia bacterium]
MPPSGGTQLTTSSAAATWSGGVDLHVGRWLGPRQHHAVEFIYWGVYGIGSSASAAPFIDVIPQCSDAFVGGTPVSAFLANASTVQIARSDLVNDVEINWIYSLSERPEFDSRDPARPSRTVNLMWLAGFRFFELEDVLTLTSFPSGGTPGTLDLGVATNNNLYGGQVGAKFDWKFLPRLRFSTVPKFLLAGNAITNTTTLATGGGAQAVFVPSNTPVNVHSTLGVFSWLGSVDAGLAWDVTDRWSLSMGYRVVGVGNIAQADGQWPPIINTPASISGIDAGSSTILHGGFAGFEGRW